jgi:hypothetical protein
MVLNRTQKVIDWTMKTRYLVLTHHSWLLFSTTISSLRRRWKCLGDTTRLITTQKNAKLLVTKYPFRAFKITSVWAQAQMMWGLLSNYEKHNIWKCTIYRSKAFTNRRTFENVEDGNIIHNNKFSRYCCFWCASVCTRALNVASDFEEEHKLQSSKT